jgi:hypothetical protein
MPRLVIARRVRRRARAAGRLLFMAFQSLTTAGVYPRRPRLPSHETGFERARICGRIISTMSLKSAAFFALVGVILLTIVVALGFIRDISAFTASAIAAKGMLVSLVYLQASLSVTVFLYVFHKTQS